MMDRDARFAQAMAEAFIASLTMLLANGVDAGIITDEQATQLIALTQRKR